jgi:hypothetical protein
MIPSRTQIIVTADGELELVHCVAIEAVDGDATFTTLEEGGVTSDNEDQTLIEGQTWYSWKRTFTTIEVATGTIYAHFK